MYFLNHIIYYNLKIKLWRSGVWGVFRRVCMYMVLGGVSHLVSLLLYLGNSI